MTLKTEIAQTMDATKTGGASYQSVTNNESKEEDADWIDYIKRSTREAEEKMRVKTQGKMKWKRCRVESGWG